MSVAVRVRIVLGAVEVGVVLCYAGGTVVVDVAAAVDVTCADMPRPMRNPAGSVGTPDERPVRAL